MTVGSDKIASIAALAIAACAIQGLSASFTVATPETPQPYETKAADEIRAYLGRRLGGGELTVGGRRDAVFHVGDTAFAASKGLGSASLSNEQWVVKSFGRDVVVNGGGTRGCLYGAYHFIEDCLGVRFWSEAEEDVPVASDLALPALDLGGKPFFAYRDIYRNMNAKASTSAFAIRRRLNRNGEVPVPAELGGSYRYGPPNHCHSASIYVPWEKYGKDHPEYFALREGVRVGGRGMQLCLSNPGVFDLFLSKLRANIAKGEADAKKAGIPPPTMYDVSMNDTPNFCQCGECAAMSEMMGISGFYLDFANRLARAVAKDHPGVFVSTLAYYFTEELPKGGIVPEDNLIVRLCDTRSNQAASIYEPGNDVFLKLLGEWGPVTKNLFVWDYAAIYAKTTHTFPFPSEFYYGDQYRAYAKHGVKGIFLEHEDQADGDLWEVKYYIETKLMEDPFVDDAALLETAIREYYGPAAPFVWKIRRHLDAIRKKSKAFIGWTPELGEFDFITPDDCRKMSAAYDMAEAAAAGDERYLRRVRKTRVGTDDISRLIASFEKYRSGDGWRFDPEDLDIVGKTAPLAVVDDPTSPSGKAVRFDMDKDPNGHYKLPFCIGVRNQAIRETAFLKFFRELPAADGYGVYTLENVEFPRDSFVFMARSWQLQRQTGYPQLTRGGRRYDIRVHARYTGPKTIPGDTRENALFVGRVEFVPSSGTDSKGTGK